MKYVAFVGKMHSGKSTLGKMCLERKWGQRIAFADPVKEASGIMLAALENYVHVQGTDMVPYPAYSIDDMNQRKGHPAVRKLLQLVGTELGREYIGPETIWIDKFEEAVATYKSECGMLRVEPFIVNDDCRFINEAERLKDLGFTVIRVKRTEADRRASIRNSLLTQKPYLTQRELEREIDAVLNHPSENEQANIVEDTTVYAANLEELQTIAERITNGTILEGQTLHTRP